MKPAIEKCVRLAVILLLLTFESPLEATQYVSNLGDLWTTGGIGDIHGLFPGGSPYGSDTARFTTGAGNFSINAVTLEFFFYSGYPAGLPAPQWISIQLYRGSALLGTFRNPVVNPIPTQWPQSSNPSAYTQFIDFSPLQPLSLDPFTQYAVVASMPSNSPVSASLLFTRGGYTTPTDWTMGITTTGNPYANGETLMMAVDASPVPEAGSVSILALYFVLGGWFKFRFNRVRA